MGYTIHVEKDASGNITETPYGSTSNEASMVLLNDNTTVQANIMSLINQIATLQGQMANTLEAPASAVQSQVLAFNGTDWDATYVVEADNCNQWNASTTYSAGDTCICDGKDWKSKINNNTGNHPIEGANWERLTLSSLLSADRVITTALNTVKNSLSSNSGASLADANSQYSFGIFQCDQNTNGAPYSFGILVVIPNNVYTTWTYQVFLGADGYIRYRYQINDKVWKNWKYLAKESQARYVSAFSDEFEFNRSGNVVVISCDNENSTSFAWQYLFTVADEFKPKTNTVTRLVGGCDIGIYTDGRVFMSNPSGVTRRLTLTYITAN